MKQISKEQRQPFEDQTTWSKRAEEHIRNVTKFDSAVYNQTRQHTLFFKEELLVGRLGKEDYTIWEEDEKTK